MKTPQLNSPDELNQYITQTINMLEERGFPRAAEQMERVQGIFYTTRSEWLGDLGKTIREIEAKYSFPDDIQARLHMIMTYVGETWPKL
jgi:truncated hemoglobin YjbI